jgi:hypothetical protein
MSAMSKLSMVISPFLTSSIRKNHAKQSKALET